ncbi:zinc finger protein [Trichonephila inaurata madagascariensis]|uniref:Zinc finger protein n=1 Tax=Trichonephila inaurata madagascariensis TaxID=2747483 RepID=A0A8X6WRJ8_9ARAC|nr:zinc finger protein [Trichonephila inaurata madagascariensis]
MEESSAADITPTECLKPADKKLFTCNCHLNNHSRTHTGERRYACDICSESFKYSSALKTHYYIHSGLEPPKPYSCEICGICFRNYISLKRHKLTHRKLKAPRNLKIENNCQQNDIDDATQKNTSDNSQDGALNNRHTELKPYLCQICLKCFAEENALKDHSNTHIDKNPLNTKKDKEILICNACKEQFSDQDSLRIHCKTHLEGKPYTCQVCYLCFQNKKALQDHNICHNKNFHCCETCGKKFSDTKEFEIHCRIHKSFIPQNGAQNQHNLCNTCGKIFADEKSLENHQQEHVKADLRRHLWKHEEELKDIKNENKGPKEPTRFVCDTCGQSFSQDHLMRLHSLDHTKEYACNLCNKRFFSSKALEDHSLHHHKPPTHSCIVCLKKFHTKNDVLLHCLSHVGGGEYYICSTCKCCFKQKEDLERHNPCFIKKESE